MAKSRDEEPRSEEATSDPSAPVDTTTRGAVEHEPASSAAPASTAAVDALTRPPDARGASSPSIASPMADPPSSNPAFREIVEQHRSYLFGLALRLSGYREVAEDLVQETFKRALRRFGELRPDSHVRAWLAKILTRLFLDRNKHNQVVERAMAELSTEADVANDRIPPDIAPPEISHALRDAIERLEPELREIIECYLAEKSYKQIAAELRIPIGTVSSRMKRARERLKELLTPTGILK
jgi:RNA polymerase sigma-70 factor, ECF subfamily